jgi:hypothetical protein
VSTFFHPELFDAERFEAGGATLDRVRECSLGDDVFDFTTDVISARRTRQGSRGTLFDAVVAGLERLVDDLDGPGEELELEVARIDRVVAQLLPLTAEDGRLAHLHGYVGYLRRQEIEGLIPELRDLRFDDPHADRDRLLAIRLLETALTRGRGLLLSAA